MVLETIGLRAVLEGGSQYVSDLQRAENAEKSLGQTSVQTAAHGNTLASSLKNIVQMAAGFSLGQAFMNLPNTLKSFAAGAMEDEAGAMRLTKALENVKAAGGAAGQSMDQLQAQMESQIAVGQKLGFSDDQIRDSMVKLLGSTNNTAEAQKRLAIAQDVARATGMDLSSVSRLLGKITDESVTAFQRYGITLDKDAGSTAAFAELQKRFGGQAQAYAKTTAGQFEIAAIQMDELKESLGYALLPAFLLFAKTAIPALDAITVVMDKLSAAVAEQMTGAFELAAKAAGALADALDPITSAFGDMWDAIKPVRDLLGEFGKNFLGVLGAFALAVGAVVAAMAAWGAIGGPVLAVLAAIVSPIGLITIGIAALIAATIMIIKHWDWIKENVPGVSRAVEILGDAFGWVKDKVNEVLTPFEDFAGTLSGVVWQDLLNGKWSAAFDDLGFAVAELVYELTGSQGAFDFVTKAFETLKNAGMAGWDWISTVAQAIAKLAASGAGKAWDWIQTIANSIKDMAIAGAGKAWKWIQDVADAVTDLARAGAGKSWNWIKDVATAIKDLAIAGAGKAWGWIKDVASAVADLARAGASTAWGWIKDLAVAVKDLAVSSAEAVLDKMVDVANASWEVVRDAFTKMAEVAWDAIQSAFSAIKDALTGIDWSGMKDALLKWAEVAWDQIAQNVQSISDSFGGIDWGKMKEAATDTDNYADAWQSVKDAIQPIVDYLWPKLKELGESLAQQFKDVTSALGGLVEAFKPLEPVIVPLAKIIGVVLVGAIGAMIDMIRIVTELMTAVFVLQIQAATLAVETLVGAFQAIWNVSTTVIEAIGNIVNVIKNIGSAVGDATGFLKTVGEQMISGLTSVISTAGEKIKNAIWAAKDAAIAALGAVGNWLWSVGGGIMAGLGDAIQNAWHWIRDGLWAAKDLAISGLGKIGDWLWSVGQAMVQGLANGVKDNWWIIVNAMTLGVPELVKKTKGALKIVGDPYSEVMVAVGLAVDEGMAKGITDNKGVVMSAMDGLIEEWHQRMGQFTSTARDVWTAWTQTLVEGIKYGASMTVPEINTMFASLTNAIEQSNLGTVMKGKAIAALQAFRDGFNQTGSLANQDIINWINGVLAMLTGGMANITATATVSVKTTLAGSGLVVNGQGVPQNPLIFPPGSVGGGGPAGPVPGVPYPNPNLVPGAGNGQLPGVPGFDWVFKDGAWILVPHITGGVAPGTITKDAAGNVIPGSAVQTPPGQTYIPGIGYVQNATIDAAIANGTISGLMNAQQLAAYNASKYQGAPQFVLENSPAYQQMLLDMGLQHGLDYVPRNMFAYLHEGESVLSKAAAAMYRQTGGMPGVSVDLRNSSFTGTPQENASAIESAVERVISKVWGRGAFLAGAKAYA